MESGPVRHILYLSRWYPSKADPMLGLFVRKHALAAVAAGFRVSVVFVIPGLIAKPHELFSADVQTTGNLTEVIVNYRKADGLTGIARQLIAWNLGVKTVLKLVGKPDLIHAHILTRTALLAWYYGHKWRIRFLITEHWSRYYPENFQYKGWFRKMLTRFAVRHAAKTTVVSERLSKSMKVAGVGDNFELLPNVVDTRMFNIREIQDRKKSIISITCFEDKSKNLKMLIDAFEGLAKEINEIELVLVGEGTDFEMIRNYAEKKRLLKGSVRFTGMLESIALVEELQKASCLVLSSNYETFGIVAYEAMACGVPVIATDVADLNDFIKPDSGKIIPVGDASALKDALSDLLETPNLYNQHEMRLRVVEQFGFDAVSKKLAELYNGITDIEK